MEAMSEKSRKQKKAKAENSKNPPGRPPYEVDYETLRGLVRIHCTGAECAAVLGVKYETLDAALKRDGVGGFREYFRNESSYGRASLRRWQWKKAKGGNPALLIHLGKQHLGQSEKVDNTSSDGTMSPAPTLDPTQLDDETMEKILNAASKQHESAPPGAE
jgi:hypothetical protein